MIDYQPSPGNFAFELATLDREISFRKASLFMPLSLLILIAIGLLNISPPHPSVHPDTANNDTIAKTIATDG